MILGLILSLGSCISNKDLVYLQDQDKGNGHKQFENTAVDSQAKDYILESNDVVSVKVNHLQLTKEFQQVSEEFDTQSRLGVQHPMLTGFTIDSEGFVDLPTVGKVQIGGLSLEGAEKAISQQAAQFYTNYSVKVFLLNSFVTILGEVARPGRYPVYVNELSVLEAIGMAGDASDYADREQVRVIRNRGDKNQVILINLNDRDLLESPAFYLQPNDVVLVNPLARKKYIRRDPQNLYNAVGAIVSAVTLYLLVR